MHRVAVEGVAVQRVLSWRFAPGELVVHFEGDEGECCPLCRCGRAHWFVHKRESPAGPGRLQLDCHNCGRRVQFDLV